MHVRTQLHAVAHRLLQTSSWWAWYPLMVERKNTGSRACRCASDFDKQVPLGRAIPVWGGLSEGGFAAVMWHERKKTNNVEWSEIVRSGKLTDAIRKINPRRRNGPWTVLCDNESFLRHEACLKAYAARKVYLWKLPAKSPDLNPIEMFWGWVRRQLRLKDLEDLKKKRALPGKTAYTLRVKKLFKSRKAQRVAGQLARRFRNTCLQVVRNKGASASN